MCNVPARMPVAASGAPAPPYPASRVGADPSPDPRRVIADAAAIEARVGVALAADVAIALCADVGARRKIRSRAVWIELLVRDHDARGARFDAARLQVIGELIASH